MVAGVLVCTSTQVEPEDSRFKVRAYTPAGRAPFVVLALGSDEVMLHFSDLEALTALAVAVAEARDLLLTAALVGSTPSPDGLPVDGLPLVDAAVLA